MEGVRAITLQLRRIRLTHFLVLPFRNDSIEIGVSLLLNIFGPEIPNLELRRIRPFSTKIN